jgi:hypothetical protein
MKNEWQKMKPQRALRMPGKTNHVELIDKMHCVFEV